MNIDDKVTILLSFEDGKGPNLEVTTTAKSALLFIGLTCGRNEVATRKQCITPVSENAVMLFEPKTGS